MLNFRGALPSEDPAETPHLQREPRDQSVMWRKLRPEFLLQYKKALSPDAFLMFSKGTTDAEKSCYGATQATRVLMTKILPAYANEVSVRSKDLVETLDVASEMHRRGISMRHLGHLRNMFWHRIRGSVTVTFNSPVLVGTHDLTLELIRGQQVRKEGFVSSVDARKR